MTDCYLLSDLSSLSKVVRKIRSGFEGKTIYLTGDLGVGKTTFAQAWLQDAGVKEVVTSPTYAIANHYNLPDGYQAIHADLYRIADPEELLYLDVRDWVDMAEVILIEWPELGGDFIPTADAECQLFFDGRQRQLIWRA